jgi:MFS family permease
MHGIQYHRFRWFVALTYVLVIISSAVVLIAPAPLMGDIARTIGIDVGAAAGVTMGTFNLFVAISAIVGGTLIDRFGVVRMWFVSLALLLVGTLLVPVIGNTGTGMSVIRLIQGCGTGPIMGCVSTIAAQWFPQKERGILTGLVGLAMGAGVSTGLILTPMLAQTTGNWQTAMAWETILTVVAVVLALVVALGPKPPVMHATEASTTLGINPAEMKKALMSASMWSCAAGVFLLSWIFQAVNDLTPSFLAIKPPVGLGMGPLGAGQMFTIVQVAFMVGAVSSGVIAERLFAGKARPVVILGFLVTAVTSVLLQFSGVTSSMPILIIDLVLLGFFMAQINPQIYAFIAKNYPEHLTGKLGGFVTGIGIFGGTAGVAAGATALHMTGMYVMSINIVMLVAVVGIFSALALKQMKMCAALPPLSSPLPPGERGV